MHTQQKFTNVLETTMRYDLTPIRWLCQKKKQKTMQKISVGEDVEKLELHTLFMRTQDGAAATENSMVGPPSKKM